MKEDVRWPIHKGWNIFVQTSTPDQSGKKIANKVDSQVERRKEYKNAIYHKNSDWPLDIYLRKFKDPSGK
ncbi:hypothetical protein P8452_55848 [Trifolium repens]|nr:hypothetical protein P8452_55848 [Trifolium repens]